MADMRVAQNVRTPVKDFLADPDHAVALPVTTHKTLQVRRNCSYVRDGVRYYPGDMVQVPIELVPREILYTLVDPEQPTMPGVPQAGSPLGGTGTWPPAARPTETYA